jgi:hypothetical protein
MNETTESPDKTDYVSTWDLQMIDRAEEERK